MMNQVGSQANANSLGSLHYPERDNNSNERSSHRRERFDQSPYGTVKETSREFYDKLDQKSDIIGQNSIQKDIVTKAKDFSRKPAQNQVEDKTEDQTLKLHDDMVIVTDEKQEIKIADSPQNSKVGDKQNSNQLQDSKKSLNIEKGQRDLNNKQHMTTEAIKNSSMDLKHDQNQGTSMRKSSEQDYSFNVVEENN